MRDLSNKKILIFADSHLHTKFKKGWWKEIKRKILEADIVIINGDFLQFNKNNNIDDFISIWGDKLFSLLKTKTILIYGNNDLKKYYKHKESSLSVESLEQVSFISGGKKFCVQHGHRVIDYKKEKRKAFWIILYRKIKKKAKQFPKVYWFIKGKEEKRGKIYKILRYLFQKQYSFRYEKLKGYVLENKNKADIFIFGHIHKPKHNLKNNFIIVGAFTNKHKRFVFIKNGEIEFFNEEC